MSCASYLGKATDALSRRRGRQPGRVWAIGVIDFLAEALLELERDCVVLRVCPLQPLEGIGVQTQGRHQVTIHRVPGGGFARGHSVA